MIPCTAWTTLYGSTDREYQNVVCAMTLTPHGVPPISMSQTRFSVQSPLRDWSFEFGALRLIFPRLDFTTYVR
jgi:hypothetical protein